MFSLTVSSENDSGLPFQSFLIERCGQRGTFLTERPKKVQSPGKDRISACAVSACSSGFAFLVF